MINIEVTIVPVGIHNAKRSLGYIEIWNDNTGTLDSGNYRYKIVKGNKSVVLGNITGFPRKEEDAFDLLARVVRDAYSEPSTRKLRDDWD